MVRPLLLFITGALLVPHVWGQSLGLLAGATRSDLYVAGDHFGVRDGLMLGGFMPIMVRSRFVLRAEMGLKASQGQHETSEDKPTVLEQCSVSAGLLARYYVRRRISISTGFEVRQCLQGPPPVSFGRNTLQPSSTDVDVLGGVAFRFNDHLELGLRRAVGILPAVEVEGYGTARSRYTSIVFSYLLRSKSPRFMDRRTWHDQMSLHSRY